MHPAWAWPSAPKCTPPDYCMLPWSAVAMGAAERRANRRGRSVGEPETESETESQTNDTEPIAFVGSIGPTHMDYAATMAAVRAVARYLTAFLSEGRTQD